MQADTTDAARNLVRRGFEVAALAEFEVPHPGVNKLYQRQFDWSVGRANLSVRAANVLAVEVPLGWETDFDDVPAYQLLRTFGETFEVNAGRDRYLVYRYTPVLCRVDEGVITAGALSGCRVITSGFLAFGKLQAATGALVTVEHNDAPVADLSDGLRDLLKQAGRLAFDGGWK